jgi:hypothetical protein
MRDDKPTELGYAFKNTFDAFDLIDVNEYKICKLCQTYAFNVKQNGPSDLISLKDSLLKAITDGTDVIGKCYNKLLKLLNPYDKQ